MISRRQRLVRMLDVLDSRLRPIEDELMAQRKLLEEIKAICVSHNRELGEHETKVRDQFDRMGTQVKNIRDRLENHLRLTANGSR